MATAKETNRDQPTRADNERPASPVINYRPVKDLHLTKAGKVALGNWVGKQDGATHRVYYGAPIAKIPPAVRDAMLKSRIGFGLITMEDLSATPKDRTLPKPEPTAPPEE